MEGYECWYHHGEIQHTPSGYYGESSQRKNHNEYEQLIMDAAGPSIGQHFDPGTHTEANNMPEDPNPEAERFYKMLQDARRPLWDGCEHHEASEHTSLSATLATLSLKSDHRMSEAAYNEWMQFMGRVVPKNNNLSKDFYQAKKKVKALGLGCQKIHCCPNGCMLYYKENADRTNCEFCKHDRYNIVRNGKNTSRKVFSKMWYFPLVPRLQRLYSSEQTAGHMRWHREHHRDDKFVTHPSDAEAWMHFDEENPLFATDPRNVRLGLCSDGFAPFKQTGRNYSCWPVIVTPYNFPPSMCMRREFLFLTVLIPGPSNPKKNIDVYLRPLIDELKMLWSEGVLTYDVSLRQNFTMRAALMWTINDFPAYGMLSGWQTSGKLACPVCLERNVGFTLQNSRKVCWFDTHRRFLPHNHPYRKNKNAFKKGRVERSGAIHPLSGNDIWERVKHIPSVEEAPALNEVEGYGVDHHWNKRSIFWDLPYWKDQLLRHNLDVMHIERNVFCNILYTVMDTKGSTKDTLNARLDIANICVRPDLHLVEDTRGRTFKPRAPYTLNKDKKLELLRWVKDLKLPDGYASKLSRCVDMNEAKLFGMKSHDCHVFFQRLLPWAFKALPKHVWSILTEFSMFFREICASQLNAERLRHLEASVPIMLCKLEMIFPPTFFDSMEHLPVHLAYEARVGGPQQYRWMYPFERFLKTLKDKISNQNYVEGSIAEKYLIEEASKFASYYYPTEYISRWRGAPRNDDGGDTSGQISIFNYPGRVVGTTSKSNLEGRDKQVAEWYILNNCSEAAPYIDLFSKWFRSNNSSWPKSELDQLISSRFPVWFREHFVANTSAAHDVAWSLADGAATIVKRLRKYIINGYRFATIEANVNTSCCNYGVSVRGGLVDGTEDDYYGKLLDIIQLDYRGGNKVTLFKCDWFDNTPRGTKVDKYGNVEVHQSRRYTVGYDPFILAQQAEQVYYTSYPTASQGWMAVIKTKARNIIPESKESQTNELSEPFQANVGDLLPVNIVEDDVPINLFDSAAEVDMIPIHEGNEESDDDEQETYSDSEPELDEYETPEEGAQEEVEEQDSSE
ncbi:uncharacterized protein LOC133316129 [Gastrolobium bilobum]|uniref:uncharacterized protein LOC133316129 n=1 Tax=Gastrolobium bilobum TaxID=150636 RepID=UPI002AB04342|nr:uncharacterized protein LOC133316129 [Gastrolobium bilobum]